MRKYTKTFAYHFLLFYNHLVRRMQFFSFPLRNMFPFSVEIYFYKSLIFHWLIQGKH